tara:strand:- start:618 stop:2108 length:1491 start_codon:yes stop_codon:yes gene_type:complete
MNTVRDSQKGKVYKWEFTIRKLDSNLNEELTLPQAQELVDKAWQRYYPMERPPKVIIRNGHGNSFYKRNKHTITLRPEWGVIPTVILHEVAHAITIQTHRFTVAMHGAEFMGFMLELWKWYSGTSFIGEAKSHRLRVAPVRFKPTAKRSAKLKPAKTASVAKQIQVAVKKKATPRPLKFRYPHINNMADEIGIDMYNLKDVGRVFFSVLIDEIDIDYICKNIKGNYEYFSILSYPNQRIASDEDIDIVIDTNVSFYDLFFNLNAMETMEFNENYLDVNEGRMSDVHTLLRANQSNVRDQMSRDGYSYSDSWAREDWWIQVATWDASNWSTICIADLYAYHLLLNLINRKLNGRWREEDDKALEDLRNPKSVIIQAGYLTEREMEALKTVRVTTSQDSNYPTMLGRLETNGQVFVDSIKQLTEELRHGTGFWSGRHEKVIVSNLPITKWGGVPYVLDSINAYALKVEPDELPEDLIEHQNGMGKQSKFFSQFKEISK